ncbi:hypothetical protein [Methanolacinia paynteri]|uniref:hypothetical protein n=1 Tax=Methanolacinia paynteri TaxID=230356 RepID=UPI0012F6541D|nr:hypothetical protein [Methanolacinia paynteri]
MDLMRWVSKLKDEYGSLPYVIVPFLIILVAFNYVILNKNLLVGDYKDILSVYEPNVFFAANPLSLWNNLWLSGMPDISNFMADRLYPLSFPFYYIFNDVFIVNFVVILHILIAFFAMHKFSTLVTSRKEFSFLISLLYVFSGLMLSRVYAGHIFFVFAYAWIPLLYYYFAKILYLKENEVKNYIFLILLNCLLLAMGNVYNIAFAYLIISIFILYYIVKTKKVLHYLAVLLIPTIFSIMILGIKVIPALGFSDNIVRIDDIEILAGGGSLENNLSSLLFGTPIDVVSSFWLPESCALIGVICVLFAIVGLVFGKKEIAVPSIIAICFSFIWADGGNNLLWFIHYLPGLDNLRCPGRIFGPLLPLILLLAVYGLDILYKLPENSNKISLSGEQGYNIKLLGGLLILVKLLELPYQTVPDFTSIIALLLVVVFIVLLYLEKFSEKTLKYYLVLALLLNLIVLIILNSEMILSIIPVFLVIALIVIIALFSGDKKIFSKEPKNQYALLLLASFLVVSMATLTLISPANGSIEMNPHLDTSPANEISYKILEMGSDNPQIWAYTYGWEYYHQDFNYILMKNGIHTLRGHYPYVLKSSLPAAINIGNTTYYTADYIIDTSYLENGNQNIPEYTFKVENISVYKAEEVLPNAFVVREDTMVPAKITEFSPDEVVIEGDFREGDYAVLKTAYYNGWIVNDRDAVPIGNMVGQELMSDTDKVTFRFDPVDVKYGIIVSIIGILLLIVVILKRRKIESYMGKL